MGETSGEDAVALPQPDEGSRPGEMLHAAVVFAIPHSRCRRM
jgi:hypothetical protein